MTWLGGMAFLVVVVVPILRRGDRDAAATMMSAAGTRFRTVGWSAFAVLLVTGLFNLYARGVRPASFVDDAWVHSPFGEAVLLKLALFASILVVSAAHDFFWGPRATRVLAAHPTSEQAERVRRGASWLGRTEALLGLGIVALGVIIVRGWP